MKQLCTVLLAPIAATVSTSVFAHSDQPNIMSGLLHFFTEPDHLAISALVAVGVIISARRLLSRRT